MNHSTLSDPQAPARGNPTDPQAPSRGCPTERQAPARGLVKVASPVLVVAAVGVTLWVNAGDLNPPKGPVEPTMKTLVEVEPRIAINATNTPGDADSLFKLPQPGSYYLTGNITGESGKSGIEIAASGVTLDLMGFTLTGIPGTLGGVIAIGDRENIAIRNGTLLNWGQSGVDLTSVTGGHVEHVSAATNGGAGIAVKDGFTIAGCVANGNGAKGIVGRYSNSIVNCTANSNTATGIFVTLGGSITGCTARGNGGGITGGENSTVRGCNADGNNSSGIVGGYGSTVVHCSARGNGDHGIRVNSDSTVSNCTAHNNDRSGIRADGRCLILNNLCTANDEEGIYLTYDCRAEANHVSSNAIGIRVDTGREAFIIKNSAAHNTIDYDIDPGNYCAEIVTLSAGFSNSNPWANFVWP